MATTYYIVPDVRSISDTIKESDGTQFLCPHNTVMTGRWHKGDERGKTQYEYATLKVVDALGNTVPATIEVVDIEWSISIKESDGVVFQAPVNRVIVGRYHKGDENGGTKYATAIVKVNGIQARTKNFEKSAWIKESAGIWFVTSADRVIVGRFHKGDENADTYYITAQLVLEYGVSEPVAEGTKILLVNKSDTESFKESEVSFLCPVNKVITGRYRSGDENGSTKFQIASLIAVNSNGQEILADIEVDEIEWVKGDYHLQVNGGVRFDAYLNKLIVGWQHNGDEKRSIQFAVASVKVNGHRFYLDHYTVTEAKKDNIGWTYCADNSVMTGYHHYGDENGTSFYGQAQLVAKNPRSNPFPFRIVVAMNQYEDYYPFGASEFVILSRFRQHIAGGKDKGYNKDTNQFEVSDSEDLKFYDVPVEIVNSYYCKAINKRLFNLRPRQEIMHYDDSANSNYFLQSFKNLYGCQEPTGRIPVYVDTLHFTSLETSQKIDIIEFWLFWGYHEQDSYQSSHQGDWKKIRIEMRDGKVVKVFLHNSHKITSYDINQLAVLNENGKDTITILCNEGTHWLSGKIPGDNTYDFDVGKKWEITECMQLLHNQPWVWFGGAWGSVGERTATTGPLGPWFKRFDYWYEAPLNIKNMIASNELLIVPDVIYITEEYKESDHTFEGRSDMVMVGRKHMNDENGKTICLFATLKAIDTSGVKQAGEINIVDVTWSQLIKESECDYKTPSGYVILGRKHIGDENGSTQFKIGRITFNGRTTSVVNAASVVRYQEYEESAGIFFHTNPYLVYTGRYHMGDENQFTHNYQGYVKIKKN